MEQILSNLSAVPPLVWAILASAVGATTIQQLIKDAINNEARKLGEKTNFAITLLLVGLTSMFEYVTGHPGSLSFLGAYAAGTGFTMQVLYLYVVKPLYGVIQAARAWRAATETQKAVNTAAMPQGSLAGSATAGPSLKDY